MKLRNPPPMTTPKEIRAMSVALSRSIQRQDTGRWVMSRWWTRPLVMNSRAEIARNSMSWGY